MPVDLIYDLKRFAATGIEMNSLKRLVLTSALLLIFAGCAGQDDESFEVVLTGGRVLDPESGLDAVRNVGIRDGQIAAISETSLSGGREIDVSGLVVSPGFIDLHQHGQTEEAYAASVRDGVTSTFELEVGTEDVSGWYAERASGQPLNYGVSIGHIPTRMAVMGDLGEFLPADVAATQVASEAQIAEMAAMLEAGLAQGAVAIGFGTAYTPAASIAEIEAMFRMVAASGATAHIHVKGPLEGSLDGLEEAIAIAQQTGARIHVVHANSTGGAYIEEFLSLIQEAKSSGLDITTEAYPYGAGMTRIESALFDDWETWTDRRFNDIQWVETGERLTRGQFARYREQGGEVIIHGRTEAMTRAAIAHPLVMIASDGYVVNSRGHPRSSGTFARVLGKYVRDDGVLTLMEALSRMTIEPARLLQERVSSMQDKGRIRMGADADITVFDPATVIDRATYTEPLLPSAGITYVLVSGTVVIDNGEFISDARPGTAIRAETE